MDEKMFSEKLEIVSDFKTENPALQDSLSYLKEIGGGNFKILRWAENQIAIALTLEVDLPSVTNYDNIDIRLEEAILIVFDIKKYPNEAPKVFTDRLDFPKNKLAHLYIAKEGKTSGFCYVRGNKDQWYANKTIKDLVIRIGNWLRDAATGNLTEDGAQFEPLRLEGYSGITIYDYDQLATVVLKNERLLNDTSFAAAVFQRIKDEDVVSFRYLKAVTFETYKDIIIEFEEEKKKDKSNTTKRDLHYGYILWSENEQTYPDYNIMWPNTWTEFKTFCAGYGINCNQFETFLCTLDINHFVHFPVIVAIRRPKQLIGYSSHLEFANFRFRVDTSDVADGKFITDFEVKFQAHNQPLTIELASKISKVEATTGIKLIFGCGALGSKIGMHFGRSGNHKLVFHDPNSLASHNMVRHALLANKVGVNKAKALANEIKSLFPFEETFVSAAPSTTDFITADKFKAVSWLLDFTASPAFFNELILARNLEQVTVSSSNISDFGNLGITLIEGENRNPRIDDLQVELYASYDVNPKIKAWLQREYASTEKENISINVGVGCNSETTVLSDIKVTSHASFAAGVLEIEMKSRQRVGSISINRIIESPNYSIETDRIPVEPFEIFRAVNDPTWSIRFRSGVVREMRSAMHKAKKKETGGVFVGVANHKTKTIHVTNLVPAPPDSEANAVCFFRGTKGLPDAIESIAKGSGNQLGYIGEWHSHPHGPDNLSDVDSASVKRFKKEFDSLVTPLPVFLTVITPRAFLPFVF